MDPVRERAADGDRLLGLVRHTVIAVLEPQTMPVHGCCDVAVIGYLDDDLRALINVQCWTRDRPVVGQHAQISALQVLTDWGDVKIEAISVVQADDLRWQHLVNSNGVGGEELVHRHVRIPSFDVFSASRCWPQRSLKAGAREPAPIIAAA